MGKNRISKILFKNIIIMSITIVNKSSKNEKMKVLSNNKEKKIIL